MKRKELSSIINKKIVFCDLTYAYACGGGITTYIDAKARYFNNSQIRHIPYFEVNSKVRVAEDIPLSQWRQLIDTSLVL